MTVYFALVLWFLRFRLRLRLDVLVSGVARLPLATTVSVSPLVRAAVFVCCVSVPLWVIVSVRCGGVRLREVRRLLAAARTRVVRVPVVPPVRRLRVPVARGAPVRLVRELPSVWGISGGGVYGVAQAGGVGVGCVPGVTPAGWGRVQRRLRWRLALGLRCGEADGGRFLVKGQRAVAVLAGEDGGGAAVARLIGRLALDRDVWLASTWVVRFEEGAVHKTLGDCKTRNQVLLHHYPNNVWLIG